MARIVRLYPRTGAYGGYGNTQTITALAQAQAKTALAAQSLNHQKQLNSLQLQALGAVGDQKIENAELRGQLVYGNQNYTPYAAGMASPYGGYGYPTGIGGAIGGWGQMGIPGMSVGLPGGFPGSGQSNITTQTAQGAANQSVSNTNTFTNNVMMSGGFGGGGGFPFGGLMQRFLGGGW